MEKQQMIDLVQKQLGAYNSRDLAQFVACFHSEVRVIRLQCEDGGISGMEDFQKLYRELFESSPSLHCELKSRIVLEATVIDEEWISGAKKYPAGRHAVAIYAFRSGLIDRVWFLG